MQTGTNLSLDDLAAFDPQYPRTGGAKVRVCCPFCGNEKRRDNSHRCFSYNDQTGAYRCWRCDATGKLTDFYTETERTPDYRSGVRMGFKDKSAQARARFGITDKNPTSYRKTLSELNMAGTVPNRPPATSAATVATITPPTWQEIADTFDGKLFPVTSAEGATGAAYLAGRGLNPAFCHQAGARFAPSFYGAPAIMFPIRTENTDDGRGGVVAVQGRFTNGDPRRMRSKGARILGVFATPGALDKNAIPVIVEAPIDALSLAAAGVPSIALCGSNGVPAWLIKRCGLRVVVAAFDNDEPTERHPRGAGNHAAEKLAADLAPVGATVKRLCPSSAKDWNAILQSGGVDALRAELKPMLAMIARQTGEAPAPSVAPVPNEAFAQVAVAEDPKRETVEAASCEAKPDTDEYADLYELAAEAEAQFFALESSAPVAEYVPEVSTWARSLLASIEAKTISDWKDGLTDLEYACTHHTMRVQAEAGTLPIPSASNPLLLRSGTSVPDPNRFITLTIERITKMWQDAPSKYGATRERIEEAIHVCNVELDTVAHWYHREHKDDIRGVVELEGLSEKVSGEVFA